MSACVRARMRMLVCARAGVLQVCAHGKERERELEREIERGERRFAPAREHTLWRVACECVCVCVCVLVHHLCSCAHPSAKLTHDTTALPHMC